MFLSTENLQITSRIKKLNPKFIGPYRISRMINEVAAQLELPASMKIQNVFHVSKLKLAKQTDLFPNRAVLSKPPPVIAADNDKKSEWEVDKITDKRKYRNRIEYKVQWRGYDKNESTWEPISNLHNSRQAVRQFESDESAKKTQLS